MLLDERERQFLDRFEHLNLITLYGALATLMSEIVEIMRTAVAVSDYGWGDRRRPKERDHPGIRLAEGTAS